MLLYKTDTIVRPSIVGKVDSDEIWNYVANLPFERDHFKSTSSREVCHIGKKITYNRDGNVYQEGYKDERISSFFSRLNSDWGVGLAMKYEKGGRIGLHRDSTGYGIVAHSISSCEFYFELDNKKYRIPANTVISFPTKVPHSAYHLGDCERFVLCCWEFTPKLK